MATTKKTPGIIDKVKDAVTGLFTRDEHHKSPKRVAAGKKAAATRAGHEAVTATKKAVKKAVTKTRAGARKVGKKVGATKAAAKRK